MAVNLISEAVIWRCSVENLFFKLNVTRHNDFLHLNLTQACNFILKKKLWYRCFPVNFVEFLRAPFLQNSSGRLVLITVILMNAGEWLLLEFGIMFIIFEKSRQQVCCAINNIL